MKTDNELIAAFMGMSEKHIAKCDISYNENWSMLMPVVEKIESLGFTFLIIGQYSRIQRPREYIEFSTDICKTKIESVYKGVVEFIKWYNSQNP